MVQRSGPSEEKITTDQRCLIHCYQTLPSSVGQRTLLEYCNIQAEASVGNNCIVSNVELPSGASIPDNTFMMTVCVTVDNVSGLYVTVVFGIKDNVKKMAPSDDLAKLQYFGFPLDKAMSVVFGTGSDLLCVLITKFGVAQNGSILFLINSLHPNISTHILHTMYFQGY